MKYSSIIEAVRPDSRYIRSYAAPTKNDGVIDSSNSNQAIVLMSDSTGDDSKASEQDTQSPSSTQPNMNIPGESQFWEDITNDFNKIKESSLEHGLSNAQLWETEFSHIGRMYHLVRFGNDSDKSDFLRKDNKNGDQSPNYNTFDNSFAMSDFDDAMDPSINISNMGFCSRLYNFLAFYCDCIWNSIICSFIRGKACIQPSDAKYVIYRADANSFVNEMLITDRMLPDHMPQCYANVLDALVAQAKNEREHNS